MTLCQKSLVIRKDCIMKNGLLDTCVVLIVEVLPRVVKNRPAGWVTA